MAAAAFNVIGLIFGVVSMAPMLKSMLPDRSDSETTIRIGVGTSIRGSDATSGNTPGIRIFDVMGRDIGEARGSKKVISDGGFKDIKVSASSKEQGRQAQYISVSKGGNDALCISYISVTWPDGQQKAWYGDVGYQCGGYWYNSQTIIGDDNYQPKCVWIDGDDSNGITTQGMGIHITDFTATKERAKAYADDPDTMCKSKPRFKLYDDLKSDYFLPYFNPPLEYDQNLVDMDREKVLVNGASTGKLPPKNKKRSPRERRALVTKRHVFPGQLITSGNPAHSAMELCNSGNSVGPDFVSHHEGLFCDMSEKELWPLCSTVIKTGCFDTTNNTMIAKAKSRRDDSTGRIVPQKDYVDVSSW
ncbi:Uncharacterized protein BP5553_05986 [Venustampulla echinocandica]|uniref:Uncharacterized protein n=1 Tax=Venustampulla echinocandica TaxID=2656787 RepID=A0A370TM97_9HELO|nr:Uncharacterized protein BP5553_05986 [Venustampulla echinocandica]RDL36634.1 Uncharacterized protein BP5553_05986 [Venustampulla echinocandica]